MSRFGCCIGVFFVLACASATKFSDCGSSAQVSKVDVTGCPDSADTCILKRGTKTSLAIDFQSKSDSKAVKAVVHGVIHGVELPFPLPPGKADGCKTGVTCPMKTGQSYNYVNAINVKSVYPAVEVTVKWELQDDSGNDIVCVEIPSKLE